MFTAAAAPDGVSIHNDNDVNVAAITRVNGEKVVMVDQSAGSSGAWVTSLISVLSYRDMNVVFRWFGHLVTFETGHLSKNSVNRSTHLKTNSRVLIDSDS